MTARAYASRPATRFVLGAGALSLSFAALSGLAYADDSAYLPGDSHAVVSSASANAGESVTFNATGYDPDETVSLALSAAGHTVGDGTARANAAGFLTTPVPLGLSGMVTVSATGMFSGHMATSTVTVSGNGRGGLAYSGDKQAPVPITLAGMSALSLAALALVGAARLLVLRSKAMARHAPFDFSASLTPAVAGHRATSPRPARAPKGGKHRKR